MKGKTSNGFEYDVPEKVFSSMRVIEYLSKLQTLPDEQGFVYFPLLVEKVMGIEQKERFYDFIESLEVENETDTAAETFFEIVEAIGGNAKNS